MTLLHRSSKREIFELIRRDGSLTRRRLCERTGLSRSLVAQTVSELIAEGLVVERIAAGHRDRERGRPTAVLRPVARGFAAALDFGHQHIALAISRLDSGIVAERHEAFDVDTDARAALQTADRMIAAAVAELEVESHEIRSLSVAVPFPVDRRTGIVRAPDRLTTWTGMAPLEQLHAVGSASRTIDNDANLGAWGEYVRGAGQGVESLLYVKVGDGIGAGLVVDGAVFNGARGVGGEMGHVQIDPSGPPCRCGRRGCLEAVVSPTAIRRRLGLPVAGPGGHAELVVDDGNRDLFTEAGRSVGMVVAQLCNFLDPDVVVIGGRLGAVGEPLLEGVRSAFEQFGQVSAVREVPVLAARFGARSELIGAIDRAIQSAWVESR